jgi:hypothetical protein
VNLCGIGGLQSKILSPLCRSTYVHNICHFALLLCWTRVTYWSNDDPSGDGQSHYPVGKVKNSTRRHFKKQASLLSYQHSYVGGKKLRSTCVVNILNRDTHTHTHTHTHARARAHAHREY